MLDTRGADAWMVRAARNQSLFRAVNEELRLLRSDADEVTIACECADLDCVEAIPIQRGRYAATRRDATRFIVLPGHVYPEVEHVVEEEPHYVVVEKIGEAAEVAVLSDVDDR